MSAVKDAADDPGCQGLREQWYYLRFYVRRAMPPTDGFSTGNVWEKKHLSTIFTQYI